MKPWMRRLPKLPPVYPDLRAADLGKNRISEVEVPDLDARVGIIAHLVKLDMREPESHRIAYAVTQPCMARDDLCEARAIFNYVTQTLCRWNPVLRRQVCAPRVRYTGESNEHDTYRRPLKSLEIGGGDCDDAVTVVALLAKLNGFEVKARVTSNRGNSWDHIYPLLGLPKGPRPTRWMPCDTTLGAGKFGQHPPQVRKHREFQL